MKVLTAILVFVVTNWYTVSFISDRWQEFKQLNSPIAIKPFVEDKYEFVDAVDIDKDGEKEIFLRDSRSRDKYEYFIYRLLPGQNHLSVDTRIETPRASFFLDVSDGAGKSPPSFRFLTREGSKLLIRYRDQQGGIGTPVEFDTLSIGFSEKGFGFASAVIDTLEPGGREKLFITYSAGYTRSPRGIACIDPETGELLWEYPCGTFLLGEVIFKDLDGDKKKEIILNSGANNNGVQRNGTDDHHSYVIVLDSNGNERWKRITGSWYTYAQSLVVDVDADGFDELVVSVACHQAHHQPRGKLYIFDGKTGCDKVPCFTCSDASFCKPCEWKRKGEHGEEKRLFIGDSRGRILMLDHGLNVLKTVKYGEDVPINALDMSQGENLFICTPFEIAAYDSNLKERLIRYPFRRTPDNYLSCIFVPIAQRESNYIFAVESNVFEIYDANIDVSRFLKNIVSSGLLFSLVLLLLFNGFFIYFVYLLRLSVLLGSRRKRAEEKACFFETVQAIAYRLKNPTATIQWTAEKIKRNSENVREEITAETYIQLADSLADDVNTLRRFTSRISMLLREQKPRPRQKRHAGEH